ncbi:hypothetical protein [Rhodococcus sp. LB1]|uniref:hypothetical protein n=1 Tax=Rhodococcus sp. LB1 TaxID=1807499 RepID=UPI000A8AB458|nr:hypothetical protein [Rhodococcus sp. LB1]
MTSTQPDLSNPAESSSGAASKGAVQVVDGGMLTLVELDSLALGGDWLQHAHDPTPWTVVTSTSTSTSTEPLISMDGVLGRATTGQACRRSQALRTRT